MNLKSKSHCAAHRVLIWSKVGGCLGNRKDIFALVDWVGNYRPRILQPLTLTRQLLLLWKARGQRWSERMKWETAAGFKAPTFNRRLAFYTVLICIFHQADSCAWRYSKTLPRSTNVFASELGFSDAAWLVPVAWPKPPPPGVSKRNVSWVNRTIWRCYSFLLRNWKKWDMAALKKFYKHDWTVFKIYLKYKKRLKGWNSKAV